MPKPPQKYPSKKLNDGIKNGYRSGLEDVTAAHLKDLKVPFQYEPKDKRVEYEIPTSRHTYTPDFVLPNGIIVETKGRFLTADRTKHLLIQQQHPELDIRFVFSNAKSPIYKGSKTSCAGWCIKHGFLFSHRVIPLEWLSEPKRKYVMTKGKEISFKPEVHKLKPKD